MGDRRSIVLATLALAACARSTASNPDDAATRVDGTEAADAAPPDGDPSDPSGDGIDRPPEPITADAGEPAPPDAGSPTGSADAGPEPAVDAGRTVPSDAGSAPVDAGAPSSGLVVGIQVGGTGGDAFDDTALLPTRLTIQSIGLSTGSRVDRVALVYGDGTTVSHGGTGGTAQTLTLNPGEYLVRARLCTGTYTTVRVFYALFTTSQARSIGGGSETADCTDFVAPDGFQIGGLYGRAADEIDALGLLFVPWP